MVRYEPYQARAPLVMQALYPKQSLTQHRGPADIEFKDLKGV